MLKLRPSPRDWSRLLKELPLKVVRITERDHRRTYRIRLDATVRHSRLVKRRSQPGHLADRDADGHVVQADPILSEPVIGRGTGQWRHQYQPGGCPVEPQSHLHTGKVLVDPQAEDAFVERAGPLQIADAERDVVNRERHPADDIDGTRAFGTLASGTWISAALDVGCGEGRHTVALAERFGFNVRGIDPVPRRIEIANQ
jgi:hypothetical protein